MFYPINQDTCTDRTETSAKKKLENFGLNVEKLTAVVTDGAPTK